MASNPDFVEYIRGQLSGAGEITCKKMFGDYGVYCDGKIIGLICDNQFFLKKTDAGLDIIQPYIRLISLFIFSVRVFRSGNDIFRYPYLSGKQAGRVSDQPFSADHVWNDDPSGSP